MSFIESYSLWHDAVTLMAAEAFELLSPTGNQTYSAYSSVFPPDYLITEVYEYATGLLDALEKKLF